MSKKFSKRKIILTEQMNYIEHPPFDDVGIQKNYKPNHLFYFLMILVPSCVFLCFFAMLLILKSLNASLVSIIIGIWGSYLASVLVVWLDEIRRSREKTFTRMKFQSVYFFDLKTICMGFASHYIGYLATNYPKECKRHIRTVEKELKNSKGSSWQDCWSWLNEIIQNKYPFETLDGESTIKTWMDVDSSNYQGIEYDVLKPYIEEEARKYIEASFSCNDFLDIVQRFIDSYQSSLSVAYIYDYMYYEQYKHLHRLIYDMKCLIKCIREKDYINFWHQNNEVLHAIDYVSKKIYDFSILRKDEHIVNIEYSSDVFNKMDFIQLSENIKCEEPHHPLIDLKEYKILKKQRAMNKKFEKKFKDSQDNGWK